MTTYSAIANSQIDAESYIDTVLAAQWRDNVLAIQEGDASASGVRIQNAALAGRPWVTADYTAASVDQAAIGASAVGQGELKTSLQQTSASKGASSNEYISFTGGAYTFGYGVVNVNFTLRGYIGSSYIFGINIYNHSAGTETYYFQTRYVTASRPYNHGDGEIPLFIFLVINKTTGDIEGVSLAPEAPWHYNGPTSIKADFYENGIGYQHANQDMPLLRSLNINDPKLFQLARDIRLGDKTVIEIDQTIKGMDMDLIPHPFIGNDLTGKQVILLDPVCDLTWDLSILNEAEQNITDLFLNKKIKIDNVPINRKGPLGVPVHSFRIK